MSGGLLFYNSPINNTYRTITVMTNFQLILKRYQKWLNDQTHYTEITIVNYFRWVTYFLDHLSAFNCIKLNDVDNDMIYRFIHVRKNKKTGKIQPYAKASIKARLAALDLFFTWAFEKGYCRENPSLRYKKWQLKGKVLAKEKVLPENNRVVLSVKEQQLLKQLDTEGDDIRIRNRSIVLTILASALFAEELITLPFNQLNLNKGYLKIERRQIPLDLPLCYEACQAWFTVRKKLLGNIKQPLVFFNQSLQPLSKRMLYKIVAQTLEEAGIRKAHQGPDILRQTAICRLLKTYPPDTVKQLTGLKSLDPYQLILNNPT